MDRIRVVLADENEDFLLGLADWLRAEGSLDVIGTATNGHELLGIVDRAQPGLVLLDAGIHDPNSFEVMRRLKSRMRPPRQGPTVSSANPRSASGCCL